MQSRVGAPSGMATQARLELVGSADPNAVIPGVIRLCNDKVTIGRSTKMVDIVLDLTPTNTISRRHAEITHTQGSGGGKSFIIKDLGSTNGVFVNGLKISEQLLKHGDMVQFGGAADIPVGTRFGGTGSHIRYHFFQEHESLPPKSRKRRQLAEPGPESPSARQRPNSDVETSAPPKSGGTSGWLAPSPVKRDSKLQRADTAMTVEALRTIASVTRRGMATSGTGDAKPEAEARAEHKVTGRKRGGEATNGHAVEVVKSSSSGAEGSGASEAKAGVKRKAKGRKRGGGATNGNALEVAKSLSAKTEGDGPSKVDADVECEVKGRKRAGGAVEGDAPEVVNSVSSGAEGLGASKQVLEVLRNATCGLCSELLLDASVLPCSHSFCKLCWAGHVEEKGTTCPVCMRKFHSSERNPRRCSNLDLLIASLVEKLAGPKEQSWWKARQEHARQLAAAKAKASAPAPAPAPVPAPTPSPAPASVMIGRALSSGRKPSASCARDLSLKSISRPAAVGSTRKPPQPPRSTKIAGGGAKIGARTRSNGRANNGEVASKGPEEVAVTAAATVKCDGCNEVGHGLRECPHRSESAGGESDEEDAEISDDEADDDDDDD